MDPAGSMQEFDDTFYCESRVAKMWAGRFLEGQYSQVFHQNVSKPHVVDAFFSVVFKSVLKINLRLKLTKIERFQIRRNSRVANL